MTDGGRRGAASLRNNDAIACTLARATFGGSEAAAVQRRERQGSPRRSESFEQALMDVMASEARKLHQRRRARSRRRRTPARRPPRPLSDAAASGFYITIRPRASRAPPRGSLRTAAQPGASFKARVYASIAFS